MRPAELEHLSTSQLPQCPYGSSVLGIAVISFYFAGGVRFAPATQGTSCHACRASLVVAIWIVEIEGTNKLVR